MGKMPKEFLDSLTEVRKQRSANGLCSKCGKWKTIPDRKLCHPCTYKRRLYEIRYRKDLSEYRKEYSKMRRKKNKKDGLCACGRERADGLKSCESCLESHKDSNKKQALLRAQLGICKDCGNEPVQPKRKLCTECLEKNRTNAHAQKLLKLKDDAKVIRDIKKSKNVCFNCGKSRKRGCKLCDECIVEYQQFHEKQKDEVRKKRTCEKCGAVSKYARYTKICRKCRNPWSGKPKEKIIAGLCKYCDRPHVWNGTLCTEHRISASSRKKPSRRGKRSRRCLDKVELQRLFESQNGKCALTGIPIVVGIDASVDHKIPLSRGGADDASNLQWVFISVNWLKGPLTDTEFKEKLLFITPQLLGLIPSKLAAFFLQISEEELIKLSLDGKLRHWVWTQDSKYYYSTDWLEEYCDPMRHPYRTYVANHNHH